MGAGLHYPGWRIGWLGLNAVPPSPYITGQIVALAERSVLDALDLAKMPKWGLP